MPFTTNTAQGTVQYTTGSFYDQSLIIANDTDALSSNTLVRKVGMIYNADVLSYVDLL